ncbi:MAG: DNA-binding protein [Nocardioidaceae bacterium]|nr:DNA-binding protein [Nocardioidaceae bacterium]
MRDLTPVRLTGGGTLLVLTDGNGAEYVVPVAGLRDTLGHTLGRIPREPAESEPDAPQETPVVSFANRRTEPMMESSLRPRDIQARIRAGESPEDVAAVAGTSVDKVMIFASPVLAERAHVAETALTSSVRRRSTEPVTVPRTLGPAAATRLREEGVDPESVVWDAWRREDGRWTLQASYAHEGESCTARFNFDQPGHFVTPEDDEGRWLVGDGTFAARVPAQQGLRLAPAPADLAEIRGDHLGEDAIEMVQGEPAATADLTDTVAAVRSARAPEPDADLSAETADADWMTALPATDSVDEPLPLVDGAAPVEEPLDEASIESVDDDEPRTQLPRRTTAKKQRGRAQVPSWDEIMFGGGTGD